MGLIAWLKSLFKKKEPKYYAEVKGWPEEWEMKERGVYVPRKIPKPGSKALSKGYGKFFEGKGKHQHKQYRRSTKAKVQPEED